MFAGTHVRRAGSSLIRSFLFSVPVLGRRSCQLSNKKACHNDGKLRALPTFVTPSSQCGGSQAYSQSPRQHYFPSWTSYDRTDQKFHRACTAVTLVKVQVRHSFKAGPDDVYRHASRCIKLVHEIGEKSIPVIIEKQEFRLCERNTEIIDHCKQ